jgi:hypothetical protein
MMSNDSGLCVVIGRGDFVVSTSGVKALEHAHVQDWSAHPIL